MSQIDLGNIRINWRGPYNNATNYVRHDAVSHMGSSYIAKGDVSGVTPVQGDDWDLMAAGTDQLTEEGDFLIHDGNTPVRLPRGNNAQIIQMVGNRPEWRDQSLDPANRVWKLGKVNRHGGWHTRAYVMADGTIKAVGLGSNFSNANPTGHHVYIPSRVAADDQDVRFVDVFLGSMNHYALTADGEVWSWGYNNYGQLGHGDTANRHRAKRIEYFVDNNIQIAKIITGRPNYYDYGVVYFITTDGRLYACGYNGQGNLGNGTTANQSIPVRCGALENIVDVGVSGLPFTIYAIEDNGAFWTWGWNANGQLGVGDLTQRTSPILIAGITDAVKAVPACDYNTAGASALGCGFVLRSDGTIWAAGYNGHGQLGQGDTTQRSNFTEISHPAFFTDIFAGSGRYCSVGAISDAQEIYTWGYNGYGQLGSGNTSNYNVPFKPSGAFQGNVTKAQIGGGSSYHGTILQSGNQLWAAGYNAHGNLGVGDASSRNVFTPITGGAGVIEDWNIYGQGRNAWGISVLYDDGRVDACGSNSSYNETGTRSANLHHIYKLANVLF
jgi:alpha-tubulin suppressor-like RCC1 family protein